MKAPTYQPPNHMMALRSTRLPFHRSGRHKVTKTLLFVSLVGFLACVGATYGAEVSREIANAVAGEQTALSEQEVKNARGLMIAETGQAAYTGEFFRVGERKVQLLRSLEKIAVRYPPPEGLSVMNQLQSLTQPQSGFFVEHEVSEYGITILQTPKFASLDELNESIHQIEQTPGVVRAVAVYIHEESGLELVPTDEFIVKLAAGADSGVLQAINDALGVIMVRPLWGTTDQFILAIPDCTPGELLSTCEIYWQDPAIEWAHPDFLCETLEYAFTPNDPLYKDQWHLNNTGQSGGKVNADINAAEAWEITKGNNQIIIAIIDDGMDLTHEDLKDNLAINSLEMPNNGLDDDNNGYVDDRNGWNFNNDNNDPTHGGSRYHGTLVAGAAAAKGNNNKGVAGCAFGCRLMPLRASESQNLLGFLSREADAVRYAAGFTKNGQARWRGADVINISRGYPDLPVISSALDDAATKGRNGKGCAIFCATGNSASNYVLVVFGTNNLSAGTYQIEFEYYKDDDGASGEDAVWIADVVLPDSVGTHERFDGPSMPSGWSGAGNVGFSIVDDPSHAYGTGRYVARSGRIGNDQKSILRTESFQLVPGKDLIFWTWISTEKGNDSNPDYPPSGNDGDWLFVWLRKSDGWSGRGSVNAGTPGDHWPIGYFKPEAEMDELVVTGISFPASHRYTIAVGASTDFDYRADYSQYGTGLDFVAPSGGGLGGIWTTDRTGSAGKNTDADGHYYAFSGTSASSPLAAGVAALMLSKNPDLTAQQVRDIMRSTCDQIGSVQYTNGRNQYYGYGRINARAALGVEEREEDAVKLLAADGRAGDQFGRSVSVSGDYAVVGAKDSAYLFKREGTNWVQQDKLIPPSQRTYHHDLGRGVSISGNYAVVAAMDTAHVYERSGTDWRQTAMLMAYPYESGDGFASSLSISGDYIMVGAPQRDVRGYNTRGSVFVFRRYGSSWTQHEELTSWDLESDRGFGESVSISADRAIVGIPNGDRDRAYIYERNGQNWERAEKLISPESGTRFGRSVSISGDYAAVRGGSSTYVFKRGYRGWEQQDRLMASDFGESISIGTDYLIIGASNSAYVFKRTGNTWTWTARLTPPGRETGVGFGNSVSLSGDHAIVGARYDDSKGSNSGTAYVFRLSKIGG